MKIRHYTGTNQRMRTHHNTTSQLLCKHAQCRGVGARNKGVCYKRIVVPKRSWWKFIRSSGHCPQRQLTLFEISLTLCCTVLTGPWFGSLQQWSGTFLTWGEVPEGFFGSGSGQSWYTVVLVQRDLFFDQNASVLSSFCLKRMPAFNPVVANLRSTSVWLHHLQAKATCSQVAYLCLWATKFPDVILVQLQHFFSLYH